MSRHAHRLDVLGLVVKQLAQLHGHQLLLAAPVPVKACQPVSQTGIQATSGRSSTSALGALRSYPQLGSPLGGPALLLGRLQLRVRRPSGGCNWPGERARGSRMCKLVARRGYPGRPVSFLGASGAQGQPEPSCAQARGRRRLLLPFGRQPNGRASREAPQL